MIELYNTGAYLVNQTQIIPDDENAAAAIKKNTGKEVSPEQARTGTIAHSIISAHNLGEGKNLRLRFDSLTSHDITYVGIIQTARASGMERFPIPYVLTNCHNSLCAVGGTINEDDHMFALSAAKKYGGIYLPTNLAVIHSYNREMMTGAGRMILGSDSQSIQRIETTLGTKLFTRTSNKLMLTFAGERYCQIASQILKIYNDFELEVSDISNLKKGRVTVGITVFLATYLLPDLLTEFREKCPNIEVHIVEETSTKLERLLMAGELDFALMHASPPPGEVPGDGVDFHLLHHDPFLLATQKNHPLSKDQRVVAGYEFPVVDLKKFAQEPFILVTRGQRIREVSDLILSRSGITPNVALSTKSFETARRLAFQGIGVSFVPRQYIDIFHSDYEGEYFSLEDSCHPYWTLGLAVSKNAYLSKASLCLMEMICRRFNKTMPDSLQSPS